MQDNMHIKVLPFLYAYVSAYLNMSKGYVRFVCPKSDLSNIIQSKTNSSIECHGRFYKEITPGVHTVTFETTHIYKDSSFRISLHNERDHQPCVLRDHIPHNVHSSIADECRDGSPVGSCATSTYHININIPHVSCETCYLSISQIIPQHGFPCHEPERTCDLFYDCVPIKIRKSRLFSEEKVDRNFDQQCRVSNNEVKNLWPFQEAYVFKADFHHLEFNVTLTFRSNGILYLVLQNFAYRIIKSVEIFIEGHSPLHDFLEKRVTDDCEINGSWKVPDKYNNLLKKNQLKIALHADSNSFYAPVTVLTILFRPLEYYPFSHEYSDGWLSGPLFIGPTSQYSRVNVPRGKCAPGAHYYVASLSAITPRENNRSPHGLLSLVFISSRVHISAAFYNLTSTVSEIKLSGPILSNYKDLVIPGSLVVSNLIQTCLSAEDYQHYIGTTKFLRHVLVETTKHFLVELVGTLEQGISADINGPGGFCGVATFNLLIGPYIHYSILAFAGNKSLHSVSLNGPAQSGVEGRVLYELTPYFYTYRNGWIYGNSSIYITGSKFYLYLWHNLVYISLSFDSSSHSRLFSGQLSVPGKWICDLKTLFICPVVELEPVKGMKSHQDILQFGGLASVLIDRTDVIQYSILVQSITKVKSATLIAYEERITVSHFLSPSFQDNIYTLHGIIDERFTSFDMFLSSGTLRVEVTTISGEKLTGTIPPIRSSDCFRPWLKFEAKLHEKVWGLGHKWLTKLYVLVNDTLVFNVPEHDQIFNMSNMDAYNRCDFNNSKELGQQLTVSRLGTSFIASHLNCEVGGKFTVIVRGRSESANDTYCYTPIYELRWNDLLNSRGGTTITAAALGGSFVGLFIVAIIIAVDQYMRRSFTPSPSYTGLSNQF